MIDFSKITKTVSGLDCHYLGQRTSGGQVLHRFAVFSDVGEVFCYYNEQGQKIEFSGAGGWLVDTKGHQIIAPLKIVEVTGWVALFPDGKDGYCHSFYTAEPVGVLGFIDKQQHTFRFEVPND